MVHTDIRGKKYSRVIIIISQENRPGGRRSFLCSMFLNYLTFLIGWMRESQEIGKWGRGRKLWNFSGLMGRILSVSYSAQKEVEKGEGYLYLWKRPFFTFPQPYFHHSFPSIILNCGYKRTRQKRKDSIYYSFLQGESLQTMQL